MFHQIIEGSRSPALRLRPRPLLDRDDLQLTVLVTWQRLDPTERSNFPTVRLVHRLASPPVGCRSRCEPCPHASERRGRVNFELAQPVIVPQTPAECGRGASGSCRSASLPDSWRWSGPCRRSTQVPPCCPADRHPVDDRRRGFHHVGAAVDEHFGSIDRAAVGRLRSSVSVCGGHEVEARADEFFAVVRSPRAAVDSAMEMQRALPQRTWPGDADVRVRIGIHSGYPTSTASNYVGLDVDTTSHVCALGHGGQIVVPRTPVRPSKASGRREWGSNRLEHITFGASVPRSRSTRSCRMVSGRSSTAATVVRTLTSCSVPPMSRVTQIGRFVESGSARRFRVLHSDDGDTEDDDSDNHQACPGRRRRNQARRGSPPHGRGAGRPVKAARREVPRTRTPSSTPVSSAPIRSPCSSGRPSRASPSSFRSATAACSCRRSRSTGAPR